MEPNPDEIAGVVDLFETLTPAELRQALAELAFKRGVDRDPADFESTVAAAIESYHLVTYDGENERRLLAGPAAFPTIPDGGADLPHIMDVPDRTVDRVAAAAAVEERFRADAAQAVEAADSERIAHLLDVSYELDVWGPVDLKTARKRLDNALEGIKSDE
jgi:hypothetical protein